MLILALRSNNFGTGSKEISNKCRKGEVAEAGRVYTVTVKLYARRSDHDAYQRKIAEKWANELGFLLQGGGRDIVEPLTQEHVFCD